MSKKKDKTQDVTLTEVNPYTDLTLIQRRYVDGRMQGLGPTVAARAAGCKEKHIRQISHKMERSPRIRRAIKWIMEESSQNVDELTKSDVMTGMMDAVSAAATATELVQAWREIGKLLGAYEPERKILEVRDYSREELKTLSDEDLLKLSGGRFADAIDAEFRELKEDRELEEGREQKSAPDIQDDA